MTSTTAQAADGTPAHPPAGGLVAIEQIAQIVQLLFGWQWQAIRAAREHGASWTQIGQALDPTAPGQVRGE